MLKKIKLINIFKGIKYYSFFSINSLELSIRLKEKYIIHAQDKKADLLEFLVKRFNNRSLLRHGPEVIIRINKLKF